MWKYAQITNAGFRGTLTLAMLCALEMQAGLLPAIERGVPDEFQERRAGAEAQATLKMSITNKGLFFISHDRLAQAGLGGASGQSLRLFNKDREISRYVSTQGTFNANDFVLFYAEAHDGYYTATNTYWLGTGGTGLDMPHYNASPLPRIPTNDSCLHTERYWSPELFRPYYRPWDDSIDHWFSAYLSNTKDTDIAWPADSALINAGEASIQVTLHGLTTDSTTYPDHRTRVWVNGQSVGDITYDGQDAIVATLTFDAALLQSGAQQIRFRQVPLPGVAGGTDRAYLEDFTLTYPRRLTANGLTLFFTGAPGTNTFQIHDLSSPDTWTLDISEPARPVLMNGARYASADHTLTFSLVSTQSPSVAVIPNNQLLPAPDIVPVHFRQLSDTNRQADYIVICPYEFRDPVYELLKRRHRQGLRVVVAPISDIYNEFSYGIKDADAIRQFLGYAWHHWQKPAPAYAVMIGRGTYDPRHYLPDNHVTDWIPVHLGPGPFEYTAQDNWYGAVDGPDKLTDIRLGRIPADTPEAVSLLLDKIISFEEADAAAPWRTRALLTADKADGNLDFTQASETCVRAPLQTAGYTATQAYLDYNSANQVRSALSASLQAGVLAISYFGHGAIDFWSDEEILTAADVARMDNSIYPLFVALTCANADFDDPTRICLGQQLLEQPGGGIACVAAASLPIQITSEIFAAGFFQALAGAAGEVRVGDIMQAGLDALQDQSPGSSELLFYNLLGDPALRIRKGP
ncbi:MAG: hypothetical protein EOM20_10315 [Spartobacteria bacterium]|nr:hypothetical protein [Spartobacteria bacterium]